MMQVFVYGTLKPGEANYRAYCGDRPHRAQPAYTWGRLYHLPNHGYPAMTHGSEQVTGVLLTFEEDDILAALDSLETYEEGRSPEQNEYDRQRIEVFTPAGQALGAVWGYVMRPAQVEQSGGLWVASGQWSGVNYPKTEGV